jgi:predicted acyltransferase
MTSSANTASDSTIPSTPPASTTQTNGEVGLAEGQDEAISTATSVAAVPPVAVPEPQTPPAAPAPALDYQSPVPPAPPVRTTRLVSLDALRGFDMFWIIGAEEVVHAIAAAWPNQWTKLASYQMDHSPWIGFRFYDLIFPMFVFIVGVSTVFSLGKILETRSNWVAVRRVVLRGIFLYLIGIIFYGGLANSFGGMYSHHHKPLPEYSSSAFMNILADIRLMGVLQRIAICYLFTGLFFIFFKPKVLMGIAAGLLILYWALMSFVRAPGQDHVSFEPGKNLANWVDARFLPGYKWGNELGTPDDNKYDPEGLLSTIPAIGGCMLGLFAGMLLRDSKAGQYKRFGTLFLAGVILIGAGYAWGFQFPIIKKLWTSSFVLLTAGWSLVLLSLFYLVIDVWRLRFWARPFVWIGMNAIALYLVWNLFEIEKLARRIVGGDGTELARHVPEKFTLLAGPIVALFLILTFARFLYKRQIFLRV